MATTDTSAKQQASASIRKMKADAEAGAEDAAGAVRTASRKARAEASSLEQSLTRGAEELAASVNGHLKSVGVDTDRMVDVAKEQATDLQKLIAQEIQERPLRALGLAAAVGLFVGFLSAR